MFFSKNLAVVGAVLALLVLGGCATGGTTDTGTYSNMSVDELNERMKDKDFFLVDVHIPEQEHIEGTDAFIPFDEIAANADKFPSDKDETIVVYCRSGNMSIDAALELIGLGYTDVYNVPGGINAWTAAGYPKE